MSTNDSTPADHVALGNAGTTGAGSLAVIDGAMIDRPGRLRAASILVEQVTHIEPPRRLHRSANGTLARGSS